MKKNGIYLLLFIMLAVTTWYVVTKKEVNTSLSENGGQPFMLKDTSDIFKIFLANKSGQTALLEKKDGIWIYNKKYKARQFGATNILNMARRFQVKYVPGEKLIPEMVKTIASKGIKVEFYNKEDKKVLAYYIGGITPDETGTYLFLEDSSTPYVIEIPGMEINIMTSFFFGDDLWRDRTMMGFHPDQIQEISLDYPNLKSKSFKLQNKANGYQITPLYPTTKSATGSISQERVEEYLNGYQRIIAEGFENSNPFSDSLRQAIQPFSIITVKDKQDSVYRYRFLPMQSKSASGELKTDQFGRPINIERYFCDVSWGDFYLTQQGVVGKLFVPYTYFFVDKLNSKKK